jgi:mannose-6-phosphate isomerase-like protein (cupin superfamily)
MINEFVNAREFEWLLYGCLRGKRMRILLLFLFSLATSVVLLAQDPEPKSHSQQLLPHTSPHGYVLGPNEGEHLIRNAGSIFIKVDPSRGSTNMTLCTQQVPRRTGITVHQHQEADEVLFVLEGTGFGILGDTRVPIEKGSTIYIPKGVWHGVENPDSELLLLFVVAPPGLEAFFREVASTPGAPPKQLTREQLNEIARKHGMQFK